LLDGYALHLQQAIIAYQPYEIYSVVKKIASVEFENLMLNLSVQLSAHDHDNIDFAFESLF